MKIWQQSSQCCYKIDDYTVHKPEKLIEWDRNNLVRKGNGKKWEIYMI